MGKMGEMSKKTPKKQKTKKTQKNPLPHPTISTKYRETEGAGKGGAGRIPEITGTHNEMTARTF